MQARLEKKKKSACKIVQKKFLKTKKEKEELTLNV